MNEKLPNLHQLCLKIANDNFKDRLQILAQFFLDTPYGGWQNGTGLETLDDCNYNLALLDCVTYVEVVLALLKTVPDPNYTKFVSTFEQMLCNIHYANGKPSFLVSNHFTCIDWIENNKFVVEDITHSLSKTVKVAETMIDKLGFFKQHKLNKEAHFEFSEQVLQQLQPQLSRIPYIETEELLNNYADFVKIFPEYCIVNIVRPNWNLVERIGTHLNISHLGFALKNHATNDIDFYHATSEKLKVVQETLCVYMQRQQNVPTIRGINVLAISPGFYYAR